MSYKATELGLWQQGDRVGGLAGEQGSSEGLSPVKLQPGDDGKEASGDADIM